MMKWLVLTILASLCIASASTAGETRMLTNREFYPALEEKIREAKKEILVSIFLFRTTDSSKNLASRLRDDLISAAKKGVKVTVLLEKENEDKRRSSLNSDNIHTAKALREGGVKVVFDDPDTVTHTKMVVIDGRYLFVGSHNFTDSALRWNNEASVVIDSSDIASRASSYIKEISSK